MVVFDFDQDKLVTVSDTFAVYSKISSDDYRFDLDGDGLVTVSDVFSVYNCIAVSNYNSLTIE